MTPSKCFDSFLLCREKVEKRAVAKGIKGWGTEVLSNMLLDTSKRCKVYREGNTSQKLQQLLKNITCSDRVDFHEYYTLYS